MKHVKKIADSHLEYYTIRIALLYSMIEKRSNTNSTLILREKRFSMVGIMHGCPIPVLFPHVDADLAFDRSCFQKTCSVDGVASSAPGGHAHTVNGSLWPNHGKWL